MPEATREFLAQQQQRILAALAEMRDDQRVSLAIIQRVDGTLSGLVHEIRATHSQISRLTTRVHALEDTGGGPA